MPNSIWEEVISEPDVEGQGPPCLGENLCKGRRKLLCFREAGSAGGWTEGSVLEQGRDACKGQQGPAGTWFLHHTKEFGLDPMGNGRECVRILSMSKTWSARPGGLVVELWCFHRCPGPRFISRSGNHTTCLSVVILWQLCCCDAKIYGTGISNISRVTHSGQVSVEFPDQHKKDLATHFWENWPWKP